MFNFNVGFLQDIPSCEMKNFDRLIWLLKDMSVGLTAFQTEYPQSSVSVRSTLNLNLYYSKLTCLALPGLTNSGKRKKKTNISAIYSLLVQKISMRFYHMEWSKVKEIEILIRLRFNLSNMAATKF